MVVNDSVNDCGREGGEPREVPEYRVRREANGLWENATEQEIAEFRAHDEAVAQEQREQEARDRDNYRLVEAALSQRWDDWAMDSEMNRETPLASRKRIRATMTVGSADGVELGEAQVEGHLPAGQAPVVSFRVDETILGGCEEEPDLERGQAAVEAHADPRLADFDPECLPGLGEGMIAFMKTKEARHWLHLFVEGAVTESMVANRFGHGVVEVFGMWTTIRDDVDRAVLNTGDDASRPAGEGAASEATTVAAEHEIDEVVSLSAGAVGHIDAEERGAMEEEEGNDGEDEEMDVEPEGENGAQNAHAECERDGVLVAHAEGENDGRVDEIGDAEEANRDAGQESGLGDNRNSGNAAEGELALEGHRGGHVSRAPEQEGENIHAYNGSSSAAADREVKEDNAGKNTECGEKPSSSHERAEEDAIDPHTGIPARWSEFWRAVNADRSLAVGLETGPVADTLLSDGMDTLPGNFVESAQTEENQDAAVEGAVAADGGASGSEPGTTTSSEIPLSAGQKQTNLKSWLT